MRIETLLILLIVLICGMVSSPVQAATCRTIADQQICILDIKRSAKNYWEYRVKVAINGHPQAFEVYNCRDRIQVREDGTVMPFAPQGMGDFICRLFQR